MDPLNNTHVNEKAIRLVEYLLRLAFLRAKLIRDVSEYQKVLWISTIPRQKGCFTRAWGPDEDYDSDVWIEVQTRREPKLPGLPHRCEDWVNIEDLRNKDDIPEINKEVTFQIENPNWKEGSDQPEFILETRCIEDYPEISQAWERYLEEGWLPWVDDHNDWESVHKVYSKLFAIHQEQLRLGEEYELILGIGLLTWQTPAGQRVRRHLVVANAILEFEARLGKFTVRTHTEGAQLRPELDMLDITEQPARAEETAKKSLASAEDDPWEKDAVKGVLQALVHSINSQGDYEDSLELKKSRASSKPIVEYAPALILRKRSAKGLTVTLKRIKEKLENGEKVPGEFADLAETRPQESLEPPKEPEEANIAFGGEIFFPKPSNDEQRRIVDKIQAVNGVLVQGPPGTGKSHTIANLICHLLATGQRTLITAKTPRALQVLERLVPTELRPLCINLLGSGLEEKRSLETSVGGILRKNQEWNEERAKRGRKELENRLRKLRNEKTQIDRRLRDIRESETHSQSIAEGQYKGTAAQIARAVNKDVNKYDWFVDRISFNENCAIADKDLLDILQELRYFKDEKRSELKLGLPDHLPDKDQFTNLVKQEADAIEELNLVTGADENVTDLLSRSDSKIIDDINKALSEFQNSLRSFDSSPYRWVQNALRDILGGNLSLWEELHRVTQDTITSIEPVVAVADDTKIDFPYSINEKTLYDDAIELQQHIKDGGKLGWWLFRPKIVKERKYLVNKVSIGGHRCSTLEHFTLLTKVLRVRIEIGKLWGFWAGRIERVQGPYALQIASFKSMADILKSALNLETHIKNCQEKILKCPDLKEPMWADEAGINEIIASCRLARANQRKRAISDEINDIESRISSLDFTDNAHPVTKKLITAIQDRDVNVYSHAYQIIDALNKEKQRLKDFDDNFTRLNQKLPLLLKELRQSCDESYWDDRFRIIKSAWHWAQARYWIEDYIRQEDVPSLSKRTKQIEDEINTIISRLASLHAWSYCFSRLKEEHRRHMQQWKWHMDKGGKFTGKNAPYHRREAQKNLNGCREAVPAWVMPLHRIWDTVYPAPGMFDVIIVDEASQCGVEALSLFYLGKKLLIVGDDKQISPEAVGLPRDSVHRLMAEFLYDFRFKSSFDIESSLFDHGKLRYGTGRIVLREHFRCMPEIIRFSNDLCYSDTPLIPLRQYGPNRLPPVEHVFVSEGYREGSNNRAINRPEAGAIVDRISEMCADDRYNGKTMGVVVLQGEAQAALIENQLLEQLGAEEMEKRRIICGNPYSFQGDERDIIFLSLVAASNERIGTLSKATDERRFNVAASRARDMIILFHSVTCEDLSASCLRRSLLEFFLESKPQQIAGIERDELERRALQDNRSVIKPPIPFESWFEVDVALELLRRGFNVIAQHEVAEKRIDLVVEGGQARLAVECDGDKWHGTERYEADMQRQRQLERCGWEFYRVRESAFYIDKETALQGLWSTLESRGILPGSTSSNESNDEEQSANQLNESDMEIGLFNQNDPPFATEEDDNSAERWPEELKNDEIKEAIVKALQLCPNKSCTVNSITSRVLKEVGIITRGHPRKLFERRVMRNLNDLEGCSIVEKYKAKNNRIRLLKV